VQQRLTTPELLVKELLRIKRDRRRPLIAAVITDLLDGVRSLGVSMSSPSCAENAGSPNPLVKRSGRGRAAATTST